MTSNRNKELIRQIVEMNVESMAALLESEEEDHELIKG